MQLQRIFNPPGRHQNRIFRLLQPFRAKTLIFIKKATFICTAVLAHPHGSLLSGGPKSMKINEISFEGTLDVRSRAQAGLERSNLIKEEAEAAQEPTVEHSGSILEVLGGVQSAPRIGRGESRSTFAQIDFFPLDD